MPHSTYCTHVQTFQQGRQHFDEMVSQTADRLALPPPQGACQLLVNSLISDGRGDFGIETLSSRIRAGIGECHNDFGVRGEVHE